MCRCEDGYVKICPYAAMGTGMRLGSDDSQGIRQCVKNAGHE